MEGIEGDPPMDDDKYTLKDLMKIRGKRKREERSGILFS